MRTRSNAMILTFGGLLFATVYLSGGTTYAEPAAGNGLNNANKKTAPVKRDPFWPLNYVPERIKNETLSNAQSVNGKQDWNAAMKQVVINGVSSRSDNECFAVINGRVKSMGETVSVSLGGLDYTWVVDDINKAGSVKLRQLSVK
ncbi:hypothetical protein [Pontiella sulfatireligans]|uniref:Uncharacterized protein n=1 Tax=Pontiella sulfatireligans TaxID=2750658 RepID=A0A6C2UJL7_9BACT|nr:hypothetical protein [Pontiella sulfatireligans]VGO20073.1 hypothetical protein SCARR_02133 [Pontiella sulfatireligans]